MSSVKILIPQRAIGEMNRERSPPMSTPPLVIESNIEPIKAKSNSKDASTSNGAGDSSKERPSFPTLTSETNDARKSSNETSNKFNSTNSIGELQSLPSKNSLSNNSFDSIDSAGKSPGARRQKLRRLPNKKRLSTSSLTSLHNDSNSSLASIHSSSSINHQGRCIRRQLSRSLDHLRESLYRGGRTRRKNSSFESVSSLRNLSSSAAFSRSSSNSSCNSSSNNSATNFSWTSKGIVQMAQRSNGSTVKGVIDDLQRIVDETLVMVAREVSEKEKESVSAETMIKATLEQSPNEQTCEVPILQCSMLSQWAIADTYYKVVITKYRGIPVIIRAMEAFPDDEDIQGTCCTILTSLTNKVQIFQEGGVDAFLRAMTNHPTSIVVQSAALEGLSALMPLVQHLEENNRETLEEIEMVTKLAEDMYLTEAGSKALQEVLIQVAKQK